ncbi:hypothetical protein N7463_005443 [Penicillium fimorum]|uniref:Uncharacterized protein n=1 Tax=Penicillium fimorum TaxID=1882269 RepID=A0A9W9XSL6_9EURO|nr:hypothetical protein N7463_005443 [Penicillium fimorum]
MIRLVDGSRAFITCLIVNIRDKPNQPVPDNQITLENLVAMDRCLDRHETNDDLIQAIMVAKSFNLSGDRSRERAVWL